MDSNINFASLIKYFRKIAAFCKKASIRFYILINYKKKYLSRSPTKVLNQITQKHTWPIIKTFLLITIVACIVTIVATYYEQNYKFKQQLKFKTEVVYSSISNNIQSCNLSLSSLGKLVLEESWYLKPEKLVPLLKLTYISNEYLKLLPLTWNELDPINSYSAQGHLNIPLNKKLLLKLKQDQNTLMVYDKLEASSEASIVLIHKIKNSSRKKPAKIAKSNNLNSNQPAIIGYFELPIKISSILQNLNGYIGNDDLVQISNHKNSLFFYKQGNSFSIDFTPNLNKYRFADPISLTPYQYSVTVGSQVISYIRDGLKITLIRCISLISLSVTMIIAYSLLERKKLCNSFNDSFFKELSINQEQIDFLVSQIDIHKTDLQNLLQQNHNYVDAIEVANNLERKIHQSYTQILSKIRESNRLLLKHYTKKKELSMEIVERLFTNIDTLSDNLGHNIFEVEDKIDEVEVSDVFLEVLCLLAPIITNKNTAIIKKLSKSKIKVNELILKQILISLVLKSLHSLPKNHKLTIATRKDSNKNRIIIEISDNGFATDEDLITDMLQQKKKSLIPGIIFIKLGLEAIEYLVKDKLSGDISIKNTDKENLTTILLPLEVNRSDNVIPLPIIIGGGA